MSRSKVQDQLYLNIASKGRKSQKLIIPWQESFREYADSFYVAARRRRKLRLPGILRKKSGIRRSAEFPITKIPFFGDHLFSDCPDRAPIGPRSGSLKFGYPDRTPIGIAKIWRSRSGFPILASAILGSTKMLGHCDQKNVDFATFISKKCLTISKKH